MGEERIRLIYGDCLERLTELPDDSVHSIVTDPPYGLSFMGKKWDYDVPSMQVWEQCLRVLKPGGHLLAFAGTRTQHRMAVNIEDAGFEIRDMIAWVYGSGFPKSHDVSKAIDKRGGNANLTSEIGAALKAARKSRGISAAEADRIYCGGVTLWSWYEGRPAGQQMPTSEVMSRVAADWPEMQHYADLIGEAEREVLAVQASNRLAVAPGQDNDRSAKNIDITAPATDEAKKWQGWGTALKPALEPITVARKPFNGTVASNVLEHGTGAINVDGCRVESGGTHASAQRAGSGAGFDAHNKPGRKYGNDLGGIISAPHTQGRFPANLIHDGSDEVVGLFPVTGPSKASQRGSVRIFKQGEGQWIGDSTQRGHDDAGGSAARFFYCAKASKADRGEANNHPTVKPTKLMQYLVRLVTPPDGIVLDPFMGSGSTGKACAIEGFRFIGIEREAEYIDIARARIKAKKDLFS